jgi:hypothetical protein
MKYKIKEVKPFIFTISVRDRYERAMLFCRVQEFYESPNVKFRNKSFSIWDYIEWYSKEYNGFTYPFDWSGYNIPLEVAEKCYSVSKIENKYDELFKNIIFEIKNKCNENKAYIIGVDENKDNLYKHEMCHAFYYLNKSYKKEVNKILSKIDKKTIKNMCKNLFYMGYSKKVAKDEIQAYLISDFFYGNFYKNIDKNKIFIPHKELVENFNKIFSNKT